MPTSGKGTGPTPTIIPIISISRDTGEYRFWVCAHAAKRTCYDLIAANVPVGRTMLYTDEWQSYRGSHPSHATVRHGVHEWARDDDGDGRHEVHCNTCEGAGAVLRTYLRAFRGVHKQYLHLYVATLVTHEPTQLLRLCVENPSDTMGIQTLAHTLAFAIWVERVKERAIEIIIMTEHVEIDLDILGDLRVNGPNIPLAIFVCHPQRVSTPIHTAHPGSTRMPQRPPAQSCSDPHGSSRLFQYLFAGIVPRSILYAKVMQSTTRLHDGIANSVFQEAYLVLHHPIAFHTANGVVNPASDGRDRTIGRMLRWGEFATRGFFLGLEDRDPLARRALEAHLVRETTAGWERIALQLRQAFIIGLPFRGSTQEANMTGLLDHAEGFARVACLFATVECLLVLGIGWAVDRSLRTIMPTRGDKGTPSGRLAASITAPSSALRAGSRSCWAHA